MKFRVIRGPCLASEIVARRLVGALVLILLCQESFLGVCFLHSWFFKSLQRVVSSIYRKNQGAIKGEVSAPRLGGKILLVNSEVVI